MGSAWQQRVEAADWDAVAANVNDVGGALLPQLAPAGGVEAPLPCRGH